MSARSRAWVLPVLSLTALSVWSLVSPTRGAEALDAWSENMFLVFEILPPILVIVALLDAWLPATLVASSLGGGGRGFVFMTLLGTASAGPLFIAFPIAAMLASKGARLAHVLFFLGVWSTSKLTVLVFELSSLGPSFTAIHIGVGWGVFLAGSLVIERLAQPEDVARVARAARGDSQPSGSSTRESDS